MKETHQGYRNSVPGTCLAGGGNTREGHGELHSCREFLTADANRANHGRNSQTLIPCSISKAFTATQDRFKALADRISQGG
jgi:hypothetical protein